MTFVEKLKTPARQLELCRAMSMILDSELKLSASSSLRSRHLHLSPIQNLDLFYRDLHMRH